MLSNPELPLYCAGVVGSMVYVLGLRMSGFRLSNKQGFGVPADPESAMTKWSRAQVLHTEYAPTLVAFMLFSYLKSAQTNRPVPVWLNATMIGATLSRLIFTAGLVTCKTLQKPNPWRALGASGTYICGLALIVGSILF